WVLVGKGPASAPGTRCFLGPAPPSQGSTAPSKTVRSGCHTWRRWALTCSISRRSIPSAARTARERITPPSPILVLPALLGRFGLRRGGTRLASPTAETD